MTSERRTTQRNKIISALVFYRQENEPVEKERLGILDEIGRNSLFVTTNDRLPRGAVLLLRIYSPTAPPGQAEASLRGVVQQPCEEPQGLSVTLLDAGGVDHDRTQSFLQTMAAGLRPAPAAPAYAASGLI